MLRQARQQQRRQPVLRQARQRVRLQRQERGQRPVRAQRQVLLLSCHRRPG